MGDEGMGVGSHAPRSLTLSNRDDYWSIPDPLEPSRTAVLDSCSTMEMPFKGCGVAQQFEEGREDFGDNAPLPKNLLLHHSPHAFSGSSWQDRESAEGHAWGTKAGGSRHSMISSQIPCLNEWDWLSIRHGVLGIDLDRLGSSGEASRNATYGNPAGDPTRLEFHSKSLGLTTRF
jgi:hypothetical protein